MVTYRLLESKPATGNAQRNADDEPDQDQCQHGAKGHGAARALGPDEKVEQEESAEDKSGNQQWGHNDVAFPGFAAKGLVYSCRHVSTNGTEQSRNQEDRSG